MKWCLALILAGLVFVGVPAGCDRQVEPESARVVERASDPRQSAVDAATAASVRVVFLGNSLTAGLGLGVDEAYPAVIGERLAAENLPVRVVNAGVSGDTTAGGLRRLDWLLRQKPDIVVVGLGANDGLRGLALDASEENLRQIIQTSRDAGAAVLLLGMLIPPNYGPEYTDAFRAIYPRLAESLDIPLVPFMLEGVGGNPDLNQSDGLHPNAEGQKRIAENIMPHLRPMVQQALKSR